MLTTGRYYSTNTRFPPPTHDFSHATYKGIMGCGGFEIRLHSISVLLQISSIYNDLLFEWPSSYRHFRQIQQSYIQKMKPQGNKVLPHSDMLKEEQYNKRTQIYQWLSARLLYLHITHWRYCCLAPGHQFIQVTLPLLL